MIVLIWQRVVNLWCQHYLDWNKGKKWHPARNVALAQQEDLVKHLKDQESRSSPEREQKQTEMAEKLHQRHINTSHFHQCKPGLCLRVSMSPTKADPSKKSVRVACRMRAAWGDRICTHCEEVHNCYNQRLCKRCHEIREKGNTVVNKYFTECLILLH